MGWAIVLIAIVVVLVILARAKSQGPNSDDLWPLEQTKPLSVVEQKLYWRLVQVLPNHVVLAQVQLSRFMSVKRVEKAQSWRNKIDRKSADFVICNKDFHIIAVVELDDASHSRADRKKADADKDAALKSAGIRVIRWMAKSLPDEKVILDAVVGTIAAA